MIGIGSIYATFPLGEYTIIEHTDRQQRYSVTTGEGSRRAICYYSEVYVDCLQWIGIQPKRVN